jgi:peroxiredoxin
MKPIIAFLFTFLLYACMPTSKPAVAGTATTTATTTATHTPGPTDTPFLVLFPPKWTQTCTITEIPPTLTLAATLTLTPTQTKAATATRTQTRTKVPNPAPDFSATTIAGDPYQLSDLIGSPVLLFFAASTCPHCNRMMPVVENVHKNNPSFQIVLIDGNDNLSTTKAFMKKYNIGFPGIVDDSHFIDNKYRISGIPGFVFINTVGSIVDIVFGEITTERLNASLKKART